MDPEKLQEGGYVRLISEFNDIWHEIESVLIEYVKIAYRGELDGFRLVHHDKICNYREEHPSMDESRIVYYVNGTRYRRPMPWDEDGDFQRWKENRQFEPYIQPFEKRWR